MILQELCYGIKCLKVTAIEKVFKVIENVDCHLLEKTVIKTRVVPKLVYAMKLLPTSSKETLNGPNKLFKSFIWKEVKPRIILSQIEQDISNGGLMLTNISLLIY